MRITTWISGFAVLGLASAHAADNRPVTQDQFKESLRILKRVVDRFDEIETRFGQLEKKVASGGGGGGGGGGGATKGGEEAVDLNNLGEAAAPSPNKALMSHANVGSSVAPTFKTFFDFNLVNQPGYQNFTFNNYHAFLFFEIIPTPDLMFTFDVEPTPKYYELDYQATSKLQLRAGRIWIPFDDLAPHNIFGGRVNVSKLAPGSNFLPDIWTELGVGMKYQLVDTHALAVTTHLYVVNGFQDGGRDLKDPNQPTTNYPNFSDAGINNDNNRDKAIGGRIHALLMGKLGLGVSYYRGRWNSQDQADAEYISMFGTDAQLRFNALEFRTGLVSMNVGLPNNDRFTRGGYYLEAGYKFGANQAWKILGRGGATQFDDRVVDLPEDQEIVGATLLWHPGLIEYSIEYSRDLKFASAKLGYTYTALRLAIAL